MRIAFGVEYNGSTFFGWQRQAHANSVQQSVEAAISKVSDAPIRIHAAGRTDTGVHATEQIIHFDSPAERDTKAWVRGVNTHLPNAISILWAQVVAEDFHARFSAVSRRYRYVILNRPTRSALLNQQVSWVFQSLDRAAMQQASRCLEGTHDFSSYRALACQAKTPLRTVHQIAVKQQGELLYIDIHADGFLHHMVRNIAGVLIAIGKGEQDVNWSQTVLERCDRTLGGVTAQASGLYLVKVQYDAKYGLDSTIRWPVIAS